MFILRVIVCGLVAAALAAPVALAQEAGVRARLVETARLCDDLKGKASALPEEATKLLGMRAEAVEDRLAPEEKRFARESQVAVYVHARPWSVAYQGVYARHESEQGGKVWTLEIWPTPRDAAELRNLLEDKDGVVRSLAVEALGALDLPEDVPRIARLLRDMSRAAPVLGWSEMGGSSGWWQEGADPLVPERTWHRRTVQTYAREAMRVMAGHRFDAEEPAGVTFEEWWKTHDLGIDSLWYWQQRLLREYAFMALPDTNAGEAKDPLFQDPEQNVRAAYWTKIHAATLDQISRLSPDTQAKIFLVTQTSLGDIDVMGPINPLFPEGMKLRIGLPQLTEIIDGSRAWSDCADVEDARVLMLSRVARIASQSEFPEAFLAHVRAALSNEAAGSRWMPVLLSRLLPPAARAEQMDDPTTREGYLRQALSTIDTNRKPAPVTDGYARRELAMEIVRGNLSGQWPFLEKVFYSESSQHWRGSDARQGILQALGEEPHAPEKLRVLVDLINDPRNETLFTQPNKMMGMGSYRLYAVRSLNAIAGKELVSRELLQDLGMAERSKAALGELRRLAAELNGAR